MGNLFKLSLSFLLCVGGSTNSFGRSVAGMDKSAGAKERIALKEKAPEFDKKDPHEGEFKKEAEECKKAADEATKQCNEGSNKNAQQANQQSGQANQKNQSNPGANSGGGGGGAQGECGGMGDIMKALMPLMEAFKGDCQGGQGKCKEACGKAKGGASKCSGGDPEQMQICQKNAQMAKEYGEKGEQGCAQFDQNIAAIAAAIANAAMQMAQMKKCEKDTDKDCSKPENAEKPECKKKEEGINCSTDKDKGKQECICQANPRNSGCPGAADAQVENNINKKDKNLAGPGGSTKRNDGGADGFAGPPAPRSGSGIPPGGGGGGKGGGSGGGADKAGDGGGGPKGLSKDVLGGDYGGGGAAGKVTNGGYPDGDPRKKLAGKVNKMDQRRLASQGQWTGAMGRSNWEKIRERYRDNRSTLINGQ